MNRIYEEIDKIAPFALSDEFCGKYGGHDNSGVLVDCGGEVEKILFSLDCSRFAVKRAEETGANLIVTHHPVIFHPLSSLKAGDAVFECVQAGISVISAHLNLDCAPGGIDDSLMFALGGEKAEKTMYPVSGGGYGKFFRIPSL
ncbi:MAG: Nif3-like dinuclear metal center hexameric protein, partial [Candidatus Gallimonas sp.]